MKTVLKFILLVGTIIVSFYSCGIIEPTYIRFRNEHLAVFRMDDKKVVINNIPSGYNKKAMFIIRAEGYETFIPYQDSSILYFYEDGYSYTPNRDNIEKLRTIESIWRLHRDFYLYEKKDPHSEIFYQMRSDICDCTIGELYAYEQPRVVDLRGKEDTFVWRDVMIDDFSMGYILYDNSKIDLFDSCINTTLHRIIGSNQNLTLWRE